MTLSRRIRQHTTRAIFAALWAVVLVTRMVPVDTRVLKGNPGQTAPRPPCWALRRQFLPPNRV